MAIAKLADRVKESSDSIGTGDFILNGALIGYQGFLTAIGVGVTTYYCIEHTERDQWEVGIGQVADSPARLQRVTVLSSSNNGNPVSFMSGKKTVFVTYPASRIVYVDSDGTSSDLHVTDVIFDTVDANSGTFGYITSDGTVHIHRNRAAGDYGAASDTNDLIELHDFSDTTKLGRLYFDPNGNLRVSMVGGDLYLQSQTTTTTGSVFITNPVVLGSMKSSGSIEFLNNAPQITFDVSNPSGYRINKNGTSLEIASSDVLSLFGSSSVNITTGLTGQYIRISNTGTLNLSGYGIQMDGLDILPTNRLLQNVSIDASLVNSGIFDDLRLSSNVPFKNYENVFTASQSIQLFSGSAFGIRKNTSASSYVFTIEASNGLITFGDGTGLMDVNLYRASPDKLATDDDFSANAMQINGVEIVSSAKRLRNITADWNIITTGKPTTLNGYGITDAYTKAEVDALVGSSGSSSSGSTTPSGVYLPLSGGTMTGSIVMSGSEIRFSPGPSGSPEASVFGTDNTQKSFINFDGNPSSFDSAYIMHETSPVPVSSEKSVLHLVPSDDNTNTDDYVSIHGSGQVEAIKLYTGGFIETIGEISASSFLGNSTTATKLNTARNVTLLGAVTGTVAFDGSTNVNLVTGINHTHDFNSLTNIPTTLAGYHITDAAKLYHTHSADDIVSGTLSDLRLSTNVPLKDKNNIYTNQNIFEGATDSIVNFASRITGDVESRFIAQSGGKLLWGPGGSSPQDTNLYRISSGTLQTDGALNVGEMNVSGNLNVSGSLSWGGTNVISSSDNVALKDTQNDYTADQVIIGSNLYVKSGSSDATYRFNIDATGSLYWGDGSLVGDVRLYRSAGGILKTDGVFDANSLSINGTEVISATRTLSSVSIPASLVNTGKLADAQLSSNVAFKNTANVFTQTQEIKVASGLGALAARITGDTFYRVVLAGDGQLRFGSGSAAQDTTLYRSGVGALKTDGIFDAVGGLKSNGVSAFTVAGGTITGDLIIDKSSATITLGNNKTGPHGIKFTDPTTGRGINLLYRTGSHALSVEDVNGNQNVTFIDTGGLDVARGTLSQGGVSVSLVGHTHSWSDITSGVPNTISGYGITDVYTKTETDNRFVSASKGVASELSVNGAFRLNDYQSSGEKGTIYYASSTNEVRFYPADSAGNPITRLLNLSVFYSGSYGTVWHSLNDGAGSGLDADLLDGLQSTDFTRNGVRTSGWAWLQRSSTAAPFLVTQQGTGVIADFYQGASDGVRVATINNDGTVSAPNFVRFSDGVNVSWDGHTHPYLPLVGGTLTGDLRLNAAVYQYNTMPVGTPNAHVNSMNSAQTGAIVIHTGIPVSSNTMFTVKFSLYEYNTNGTTNFTVQGYAYSSITNCVVTSLGYRRNIAVQVAYDSSNKIAIIVGTTGQSLSYPKVWVENTILGHSGANHPEYLDGWSIEFSSDVTTGYTNIVNCTNQSLVASADTIAGYTTNQNLRTTDSPTFGNLFLTGLLQMGVFPQSSNGGEAWMGREADRSPGTLTIQLGGAVGAPTTFEIVDRAWTKVIASISGLAPQNSLLINSAGNVGVGGTAAPQAKLSVIGNFYIEGTQAEVSFADRAYTGGLNASNTAGQRWTWYSSGGTARLWTPGTTDVIQVNSAGCVGINVAASNAYRLYVMGDSLISGNLYANELIDALNTGYYVTPRGTSNLYDLQIVNSLSVVGAGGVSISNNSGNLSFGAYTRQMLNLYNADYGIGVQASTHYFRTGAGFAWYKGGAHSNTQNDPGVSPAGYPAASVLAKLDSSGNFYASLYRSISDPSYYLNPSGSSVLRTVQLTDRISSTGGTPLSMDIASGGARYPYIEWKYGGVRGAYMGWGTPGTQLDLTLEGGNKLAISGSVVITSTATATGFYTSSSRKMKENVNIFNDNAMEIIKSTSVVSFNYINDPDKKLKIGFIAEDTNVLLSGNDQMYMDHANTLGLLIRATQQLDDRLEVEIKKLKNENEKLKKRIIKLEKGK